MGRRDCGATRCGTRGVAHVPGDARGSPLPFTLGRPGGLLFRRHDEHGRPCHHAVRPDPVGVNCRPRADREGDSNHPLRTDRRAAGRPGQSAATDDFCRPDASDSHGFDPLLWLLLAAGRLHCRVPDRIGQRLLQSSQTGDPSQPGAGPPARPSQWPGLVLRKDYGASRILVGGLDRRCRELASAVPHRCRNLSLFCCEPARRSRPGGPCQGHQLAARKRCG